MKTIKKIWSILLVCGLILVPTISVSAAEQEPEKVEVSFFNENGEEVSVSEEIYAAIPKHNSIVKINPKEANIGSSLAMPANIVHINDIKRKSATIVIRIVIIILLSYFTM